MMDHYPEMNRSKIKGIFNKELKHRELSIYTFSQLPFFSSVRCCEVCEGLYGLNADIKKFESWN